MNVKSSIKANSFKYLKPGEVFKVNHRIYLKLDSGRYINAIDLTSNETIWLDDDLEIDEVYPNAVLDLNPGN